jgi:putative aldouronate transport system permease protein
MTTPYIPIPVTVHPPKPVMAPYKKFRWKFSFGQTSIHIILFLFSVACLVPMWLMISASLTDNTTLLVHGVHFWPQKFSLLAYQYILGEPTQLVNAYLVSIFVTLTSTLASLFLMAMIAYPLSRPEFFLRNKITLYLIIPMLFGGGLVPYYLLMTQGLRLNDNILALILPGLVGSYSVFMIRAYFQSLPTELFDAAVVDGASEWRIFIQIALPLVKPVLATIALFLILGNWNSYINALYFISDRHKWPIAYMLYQIMQQAQMIQVNPTMQQMGIRPPMFALRMAMAVLTTIPATLAFLTLRKYLAGGMILGAFK